MTEIVMPRLSDTMEEGTILRWLVSDGEHVSRGQELVEIETDKATMVYESDAEGALQTIAAEGETLLVGAPIATIGDGSPPAQSHPPATGGGFAPVGDPAPVGGLDAGGGPSAGGGPAAGGDPNSSDGPVQGERVKASPVARRVARERGVDLRALSGSGPSGRIVKSDVEAAAAPAPASPLAPAAAPAPATPPAFSPEAVATAKGETSIVELTRTQQTIARRMAESKATIPDFTLSVDVDMEVCAQLRGELKGMSRPQEGPSAAHGDAVPTYNDMVVKACALALREHARVNGSYRDGRLLLYSRINVGVAVATEGALVVPTVFDAEEKSLGEIARETRELAERVRAGTITPPELGGGTFTVSNLGMYGVTSFVAIVNSPQAAILSVGAVAPRAVVRDGALVARQTMTITLACDHRILYGADAARFLGRIRELLERPAALTL